MGLVLVSEAPVLAMLEPDCQVTVEAEVSIASRTTAVGVLVPPVQFGLCSRVARAWGRPTPPWPTPTFLRCDVDRSGWLAVAWYRNAHAGDFVSPFEKAPVQYVAERWRREGEDERSLYIQVAGIPSTRLADAARAMGRLANLTIPALDAAEELAVAAAKIGWAQSFAATITGPAPRLKLGVATRRTEDALALLPDPAAAHALRARFIRLRTGLAYVGITIEPGCAVDLRLYSRPMDARHIRHAVRMVV